MLVRMQFAAATAGFFVLFSGAAQAQRNSAPPPPEPARAFYACAYQLDDHDKTCIPIELKGVIKNPDLALAPASLNKMLTADLTYEHMLAHGKQLDDPFTMVTRDDAEKGRYGERNGEVAGGGWTLRYNPKHSRLSDLPEDHVFTYREVILAMTVYSANDFAVAAARAIAPNGNLPAFAAMMNAEGAKMGMKNTVFKTPEGMPATGQKTTAEDMATLVRALVAKYGTDKFDELFGQETALIAGREIPGHLRLLQNPAIIGGKTGSSAEGANVAGYAQRGKIGIAFSTLGSPTYDKGRTRDAFTMKAVEGIFVLLGVGDAQAKTPDATKAKTRAKPLKRPQSPVRKTAARNPRHR